MLIKFSATGITSLEKYICSYNNTITPLHFWLLLALPSLCRFLCYLADDGELRLLDVVTINPQREHSSECHHAAHRCHVVQVGL